MAYDDGLAQRVREILTDFTDFSENQMQLAVHRPYNRCNMSPGPVQISCLY
jgi:hypothetical protein